MVGCASCAGLVGSVFADIAGEPSVEGQFEALQDEAKADAARAAGIGPSGAAIEESVHTPGQMADEALHAAAEGIGLIGSAYTDLTVRMIIDDPNHHNLKG